MDSVTHLLDRDFLCDRCGRRHRIGMKEVIYDEQPAEQLPDLCRRLASGCTITLAGDARTLAAAGNEAATVLSRDGFAVRVVQVPDPAPGHPPVCDDLTRERLDPLLPAADLYVAVGSGVVNDLVKWIAGDRKTPYVVVATAASMNGYSSDNVAPTLKGVKSLIHGTGPVAVVTGPGLLLSAPPEMTAAGLGDVLAKSVSSSDWHLNRILFNEYYCPFCAELIDDIEPLYMDHPEAIAGRGPEAVEAVFAALVLTGLAMSMAGTSSPASGGEHLISHTLDMLSALDGVPHDLHGRQVGVATILCAALYEEILAREVPDWRRPDAAPTDPAFWGEHTASVEEQHAGKRRKTRDAADMLAARPDLSAEIRTVLLPKFRGPGMLKDCLRRAGAAHRLRDIGVSRDRFLGALLHAHEIRERFTVLDLARCAGILPVHAEGLVDRWLID